MAYRYAQVGPPFNFLGSLSESQKTSFFEWVQKATPSLPQVQTFHQSRSQQLRKTAGLLEKFYSSASPDPLTPTFIKNSWTPGPDGHFPYAQRNDHAPAMVVSGLKDIFKTRLVHQDDAVFHMNHLRSQVEHQEDLAQYASEGTVKSQALMDRLETLFGQPEYQAALVLDVSDTYMGEPRFRVHQLDDPTAWERDTKSGNSPTL